MESWQNALRQLQQKFRDTYPDVKAAKEELAGWRKKKRDKIIDEEKAESEAKKDVVTGKPILTAASAKESVDRGNRGTLPGADRRR